MQPSLIRGRIVFPTVPIPDPQGQNPKPGRPFVVLTANEDIKSSDRIQAIGITSQLRESPQEHYVVLPWGKGCRTGLTQESAALCTWLIDIAKQDMQIGRGYVDPNLLEEIATKLVALKTTKNVIC